MILRIEDPVQDVSKISIKVNHNGVMKYHSRRHYVGGRVQFIDYVDILEMKLSQFKTMVAICGYDNDSVAFWHKYGRFSERMRLISTDLEDNLVSTNIHVDRIIEVSFEHLDSYIGVDVEATFNEGQNNDIPSEYQESIRARADYSSSADDFEDSDNDFSDENDILRRSENEEHRYEVSEEAQKKMANEEGDSDYVNSEGFKSLENDSDSDSLNFPKFNSKTDGLHPVLALEMIFENKKEFKNIITTHEVNQGKYIEWC
ncbi:uncharacterized protein [Nicotiana tomentosiformis]|uniref:uncharacterized protein n=1 Tax=Nicotiana tomentosiformis TaxID=4098 RepID=UPI00051B794A|nr:uncharacterized protein LOC104085078 [Nicotiana tomentosiformis]XP_033509059.1 uncharacterized protein LOC104085078 [Nicotiana tomentosiformis]